MRFKHGNCGVSLHPAMRRANKIADRIWRDHGQELVVTAPPDTMDDEHGEWSYHYYGCACDYRTWYFSEGTRDRVAEELSEALGGDYDVVVHQSHIHCEYDWERANS
jgi:hypothetical protein